MTQLMPNDPLTPAVLAAWCEAEAMKQEQIAERREFMADRDMAPDYQQRKMRQHLDLAARFRALAALAQPVAEGGRGAEEVTEQHLRALEECRSYMGTCTVATNPNAPNWYQLAGDAIALLRSRRGAVGEGDQLRAENERLRADLADDVERRRRAILATCKGALAAALGQPLHTVAQSGYEARTLEGDSWEHAWQFVHESALFQRGRAEGELG